MRQGNPYPAYEYPYYVEQRWEAACRFGSGYDLAAEGPQGEEPELHDLQSERYSYDGEAHHCAAYDILHGHYQAAEYHPYQVAKNIHIVTVLCEYCLSFAAAGYPIRNSNSPGLSFRYL